MEGTLQIIIQVRDPMGGVKPLHLWEFGSLGQAVSQRVGQSITEELTALRENEKNPKLQVVK